MSPLDRYTCEQVFRRLEDYLDGEVSSREVALVRAHLETCAQCASEYAFEGAVLADVKAKLQRIDLPQSLRDRVEAILEDASRKK
jgi:anti-sigma factor (TIGR02949 family)